jgi:hypothetical protein
MLLSPELPSRPLEPLGYPIRLLYNESEVNNTPEASNLGFGPQTLCGRPRGFKSIERILTDGSTAFMCSACCRGA